MKTAKLAAIYVTALIFICNSLATAEDQENKSSQRPYVGVRLDPNPLSELLRKHLKLKSNQGLLVYNVQVDSPADKAGVERDDIIIVFQGKEVSGYDDFVSNIRKESVGTEVELEIIHEGDRITKKLTLAPFEQTNHWKYPFREIPKVQRTPNRIFRMDPGEQYWKQIPFEGLPDDFNRFFQQKRSYQIDEGDLNLKIDIDGNPKNPDSKITVRDMNTGKRYQTTVGKLDDLPKKYRAKVRDLLENSRQYGREFDFHFQFPPNIRRFDDDPLIVPKPYRGRDLEKYHEELRRDMEKWQKDFNQRMNEMEKMLKEKHGKDKESKSKEHEDDSDSL
jgi:hypothetical protein